MTHPLLDVAGGRLHLRWRGERRLPWFYCTPDPAADVVRRFRDAGLTGVSFSATADFHPYGLAAPVWTAPSAYDWSELDRRARAALEGFPDAMLLLRVHVCSPPWWDAAHEDDLVVWDGGRREHRFLHGYLKRTCASWSSRRWRAAAATNLRRFVEHARAADWGPSVGGVLVASGNTEEWFQIGTMEGLLPDYSRAAAAAFRDWLASRGLENDALRERWGVAIDGAGATIPPPERRRPGRSHFRDPVKDAWAIDFEEFLADEAASFIGELCAVVHEASDNAWFAGAFFGYLTEMAFHGDGVLHGGHLGLSSLLRDPRVDFLASPGSYARRDVRDGASQSMLPVRAILDAGKAVFHENDVRTHVLYDDAGYGWTERACETSTIQAREAAFALTQGAGLWWFDMSGTFYEDPATLDAIARIAELARIPRPARKPAPIAFVLDEESFSVTDFWADRYADAIPRQLLELARVGAAHDVRLLGELPEDHGYAYLVFPNLFRVEPGRLKRIRRRVQRARGALFIGPVGLAPTRSGAAPGPGAVTGLPIEVRREPCFVEIALDAAWIGTEPDAAFHFGRRFWHDARVAPDRDAVRVLGTFTDSGTPAFFEGMAGGVRVAFAADAMVPAAALRKLVRECGVPIACGSGDVFTSDGSMFLLVASTAGVKHVTGIPGASARLADPPVVLPVRAGAISVPLAMGRALLWVAEEPATSPGA